MEKINIKLLKTSKSYASALFETAKKQQIEQKYANQIDFAKQMSGLPFNKLRKQQAEKLTYLGYTFLPNGEADVEVSIAERKVNMIKTRITKSFVRFAKDGDFAMLKNRIKFLTGNYTLYNPSTLLPIKVGIYFNYNMLTDKAVLYALDKYYQNLLHCRSGRLGSHLAARMSVAQRSNLAKYSFVFGFEHHVNHFFTSAMLADITDCWP